MKGADMYLPKLFQEDRPEILHQCMCLHSLATLVTLGPDGLEANPIPLLHDPTPRADAPYGILYGHLARANPQWKHFRPEIEALAIFQGPNAYVSPNWYPSKVEHGKAVPTWNYVIVQARGALTVFDDRTRLRRLLTDLTAVHESAQPHPWSLGDAPEAFIAAQLEAIVGIEIAVRELSGKWKMSQNKDPADRQGVSDGLATGSEMQKAVSDLITRE